MSSHTKSSLLPADVSQHTAAAFTLQKHFHVLKKWEKSKGSWHTLLAPLLASQPASQTHTHESHTLLAEKHMNVQGRVRAAGG